MTELRIDALLPAEMARRAEYIGERKSEASTLQTFALALMAGAFIAFGAIFATTVATGASGVLTYGVTKLLVGLAFCLGLILVIVGGAELFTGNNLIVMAWASGKVSTKALLRNWGIVYLGNFVGSLATVCLLFASKQYLSANGDIGLTALKIANAKVGFGFWQALSLGILCNILVCLAVWLTFSA
ncbi:MAG: formate transporter FocA, partial [Chloroflexi bacterium]